MYLCFSVLHKFGNTNVLQCAEVRLASFLSGVFITATVVNPPERKLAKRTSVHCAYVFTKLVIKCSFLKQSLPTSTVWNLRSKPSYNNVLGTSSLLLLVPPPAKAGGSHQNTMLIMWEPLIMQEPLIMREPESGRSWTSKVFNSVITLDTYQF